MFYNSSKDGAVKIQDMHPNHIENAIAKLKRRGSKSTDEWMQLGALIQSLDERAKNPSTSLLKAQIENINCELAVVKKNQQVLNDLKEVLNRE